MKPTSEFLASPIGREIANLCVMAALYGNTQKMLRRDNGSLEMEREEIDELQATIERLIAGARRVWG